jgi:hypothetical protein
MQNLTRRCSDGDLPEGDFDVVELASPELTAAAPKMLEAVKRLIRGVDDDHEMEFEYALRDLRIVIAAIPEVEAV